ncbi:hypothetical protein V413_15695 [Escherichia coli LAU-EC8]|nr:hypothetical protein V413_15695 [Escherichia coli LAU-EC8]ETE32761.1 hypothetical protein V414_21200 [Escherichia coli LAU-EC9]
MWASAAVMAICARTRPQGENSAAFFVRKMQRLQADNILRNAQHRVKK